MLTRGRSTANAWGISLQPTAVPPKAIMNSRRRIDHRSTGAERCQPIYQLPNIMARGGGKSRDVTGRTRLCGIFPVRASLQLTIGELLLTQLKLNALRRPATLDAEQGAETSVVPVVAPLVGHL